MAIAAAKINELGRLQGAALETLIHSNPKAKLDYQQVVEVKTPSGNLINKKKIVPAGDFKGDFDQAVAESATDQNTVPLDDWIYKINKPTFSFSKWLYGLIDAVDALNADGIAQNNSKDVPKNIFEPDDLSDFFAMSLFACGDAGAFPSCISNGRDYYYKSQVLNRAFRAAQDSIRATADNNARTKAPGGIKQLRPQEYLDSAKTVYENLKSAKLGICTTFAWGAAYPLMNRMYKAQSKQGAAPGTVKRIEVVAFANHIFTVINRAGDAIPMNERLPATSTWGDDVLQVDAWLGTLGWSCVYQGVSGDNRTFLAPLTSLFDSKTAGWT